MKDIPMLYTVSQTAATETESLHAVVSLFTPKMLGFHFEGIACNRFVGFFLHLDCTLIILKYIVYFINLSIFMDTFSWIQNK